MPTLGPSSEFDFERSFNANFVILAVKNNEAPFSQCTQMWIFLILSYCYALFRRFSKQIPTLVLTLALLTFTMERSDLLFEVLTHFLPSTQFEYVNSDYEIRKGNRV